MPESIIIYDVRENCAHTDDQGGEFYVESISQRLFQTMASAQLYLQELLNLRISARLASAERYPHMHGNTPQALADLAANKLHFDPAHHISQYPQAFENMPIFFIQEQKVLY